MKHLTLLVLLLVLPAGTSQASGFMNWVKGCVILGGATVGGTVMAVSNSKAELKDSQALVVSGVAGCIIGGFMSSDISRRAELKAEAELKEKNRQLKYGVYSVMHDLCVMKGECGPDGLPLKPAAQTGKKPTINSQQPLKSGN